MNRRFIALKRRMSFRVINAYGEVRFKCEKGYLFSEPLGVVSGKNETKLTVNCVSSAHRDYWNTQTWVWCDHY